MRYAEYMQQIDHLKINLSDMSKTLDQKPIEKWAYCVHNKDTYDDGTPKPVHLHIMMKLNSDQTPQNIAKWFSDESQYIEKAKSQNKAFIYENMCSYLVHETETADGKFHYPDDEVVANFDFHEFMEKIRKGVHEASQRKKKHPIQDVLEAICQNKVPRLKLAQKLTDMDRIKYDRDIERAYKIRDEKLAMEIDRDMNVMYFSGESGTGKTMYAKQLAKKLGYDTFVSGSSNDPLQGYLGQECVILDDIRGSDWKINDLLKLLDPNTNSLVKSRYSNKLMNDCKLIILTSVLPIEDLYKTLASTDNEPIEQLKRRITDYVIFSESELKMYQYDPVQRNYVHVADMPNPINLMKALSKHTSALHDLMSMIDEIKDTTEDINDKGIDYDPFKAIQGK